MNRLNAGFAECDGEEVYFFRSFDPIFFQDEPTQAKIKDVVFVGNSILLYLRSNNFTSSNITYVFGASQKRRVNSKSFNCFLEQSLSSKDITKVYLDTNTNQFHVYNNNHYKNNLVTEQEAIGLGAKPDKICFPEKLHIPDLDVEQNLAREAISQIMHMAPVPRNDKRQLGLTKLGNSVLASWPYKKIGYNYKFVLLDSQEVQAYAIPAGGVYVTSGLYDSLPDELELRAVLAHEIAHVEKRHALRPLQLYIQQLKGSAAMNAFAGAAAQSGNSNAAIIFVTGAVINSLYQRYPKELEREADFLAALYFKKNNLKDRVIQSVFRKLQFVNLARVSNPDPRPNSHPLLEERINYVKLDKFETFEKTKLVSESSKLKGMEVEPIYLVDLDDKYFLYVYFNQRKIYDRYLKEDSMKKFHYLLNYDGKDIRLQKVTYVQTSDTFGIYHMFKFDKDGDFDASKLTKFTVKDKSSDPGGESSFYFSKR